MIDEHDEHDEMAMSRAIVRASQVAKAVVARGHVSEAQALAEGVVALQERVTQLARQLATVRGQLREVERAERQRSADLRAALDDALEAHAQAEWWRSLVKGG